jgi:peptidoglycan/LPS O-acetylase OafA/YrhL
MAAPIASLKLKPSPAGGTAAVPAARVPELDGIRGLAILPVLVAHFAINISPPGLIHNVIGMGWVGVDLFFVLSGLLITGILLDARNTGNYFRRFYLRRVFRILPIYYLYLLLFFEIVPPIAHWTGKLVSFTYGRQGQLWYWLYLSNWRDTISQSRYLRHFWSLSIEEQFYLLWPLIVYVTPRHALKYVCLGFVILSPALRFAGEQAGISPYALYAETPFRLEGLALGALLALAAREVSLRNLMKRVIRIASPAAVAVLAAVFMGSGSNYVSRPMVVWGYTAIAILGCSFVFLGLEQAGTERPLAWFLRQPWLMNLGKYSYGLYVWHQLVAEQVWITGNHLQQRFGFSWILVPLSVLVGIACSYSAAVLSWRLIEAPCARLKERWAG